MKKAAVFLLAWTLILSLAACGGNAAPSQSAPAPSQSQPAQESAPAPETSQSAPASSEIGAAPQQSAPSLPQGDPEVVDLDKLAELYSQDGTNLQDRLGGKYVEVTGYLKADREKDRLYLWGVSYDHKESFGDNPIGINLNLELSAEAEALLRGEEYSLAWITLTGRVAEGMTEEFPAGSSVKHYSYTMGDVGYVTNVHQVTGILNKDQDGDYWMEGLGYISFVNKAEAPPDGTQVTISGKLTYGGDFREAVVVE